MLPFPELIQHEEFEDTRPIPLHELSHQTQIDHELDIVKAFHERIAHAIRVTWGHQECVDYLARLIFEGGDGIGRKRVGFKREVLTAFINLASLHELNPP